MAFPTKRDCFRTQETVSQLVKSLLFKHGHLNSDPALKPGMVVVPMFNSSSGQGWGGGWDEIGVKGVETDR